MGTLCPVGRAPPAHLAGVQHVGDGAAAEVGRGDDVLLPTRVPSGHRFGRCHGDALGLADKLLWRGRLGRRVRTVEHLGGQKRVQRGAGPFPRGISSA